MTNIDNKNTYKHSEEFRKEFGERLRMTRKEKGMSIDQARSALGIPRSTYSGWELGRRIPLSKSLSDLANLFETNVDYLMLKSDDPNPPSLNELNEVLSKVDTITWKGKPISEEQASTIAALIEAFLDKNKKG